MKLFSLEKQVELIYHIHLSNLTIITFLNSPHQKHLGIVLDSKLNFNAHVDQKIKKCNRIIGLIRQQKKCYTHKKFKTSIKSWINFEKNS